MISTVTSEVRENVSPVEVLRTTFPMGSMTGAPKISAMKIVLLGYGKMGKAIEETALSRGHHIAAKVDVDNRIELDQISAEVADVAIEFSQPNAAYENIKWALSQHIPVVSGTTGWLDKWDEVSNYCNQQNGA